MSKKEAAYEYYHSSIKGKGVLYRIYMWISVILPAEIDGIGLIPIYILAAIIGLVMRR